MTTATPTIIGISGSLRRASYNTALLRAASDYFPSTVRLDIGSIREIPLYDGDLEAEQGIPEAVRELKEKITASAGLFLVTPEYNSSIPGVLKNAIDWLSRPGSDAARVFGGRPIAILGASPGRLGTVLSQTAWLPVVRALGMKIWEGPRFLVSQASQVFDESGQLVDERVRSQLESFVQGFAEFALKNR